MIGKENSDWQLGLGLGTDTQHAPSLAAWAASLAEASRAAWAAWAASRAEACRAAWAGRIAAAWVGRIAGEVAAWCSVPCEVCMCQARRGAGWNI